MNGHQEANDRFYRLLRQQDQQFQQRVEERSKALEQGLAGTGECNNAFNEVLRGSSWVRTLDTGALPSLEARSAIAKETAAILCRISLEKGLIKGKEAEGRQRLGWDNLNKDAKGWCKNLLLTPALDTATSDEVP